MNDIYQSGRGKVDVTSVTVVNNTLKLIDIIVPAGKRWYIILLKMANPDDVNRVCKFDLYKEAAKTNYVTRLQYKDIAQGALIMWPVTALGDTVQFGYFPLILDADETIEASWEAGGASAGGTDADGLVVKYLEFDI